VTQLPKNDRNLNLRLSQDLYDKALAAATAEQRPLSSWVRKFVHRELAGRLSAEMDADEAAQEKVSELAQRTTEVVPQTGVGALAATQSLCKHPINRRIGTGCAECGKDPVK
jgi:hypothetical protein